MWNKILRYIYTRNEKLFNDFLVESIVGKIPKDINEPSIDFIKNGGEKLERWIMYQVYYLNRRMVADPKGAERYQGMLTNLKFFLVLASTRKKEVKTSIEEKKEVADPMVGVEKFKNFKK
jgi:hypothetical protein